MKRKVAAGGIVIRSIDNRKQAILVQHNRHKGWGFPKGHIDKGESPEEAALREVEEETGVLGTIVANLPTTRYRFTNTKGTEIDKTVYWFLMRYQGIGHQTHSHEVADVRWVSLSEISGVLAFDNDRMLFGEAQEIISEHFR